MSLEVLIVVAAIALSVGIIVGRLSAPSSGGVHESERIRLSKPLMADVEARVVEMIAKGQKILALHEVRQATGVGLQDGKRIVNWLEDGKPLSELIEYGSPLIKEGSEIAPDQMNEIKALIKARKKIEALKLYREASGLGLKHAKEEVARIERELR